MRNAVEGACPTLLLLPTYGGPFSVPRSHKAAFQAHLTKPVRFDQLEEILDDVFAHRPGSHQRVRHPGGDH